MVVPYERGADIANSILLNQLGADHMDVYQRAA